MYLKTFTIVIFSLRTLLITLCNNTSILFPFLFQSVNKYERPWMPDELKSGVDKTASKDDTKVEVCPIKGSAFILWQNLQILFVQPLYCHLHNPIVSVSVCVVSMATM